MEKTKKNIEKPNLHFRNSHKNGYDFEALIKNCPPQNDFVFTNQYQIKTIDFSDPSAVHWLNKALLSFHYNIDNWDIPANYLCPAIPSRADYIHYIADLLASSHNGTIPTGENIMGLDLGIGANCIYPLVGNSLYGWSFVGTDTDEKALQNCKKIIANNPKLIDFISLQLQGNPRFILKDIIEKEDKFAFTICNPPFHSSKENANQSALRKIKNLDPKKLAVPQLNFGGQNNELWCEGGEIGFITQLIYESAKYPLHVFWFTTLVSKKDNLKSIFKTLNKVGAVEVKTIEMSQGRKISRIVAWTFLSKKQQEEWTF